MSNAASSRSTPGGGRWSPPREFDEYRLLRPIGRGRNGRVYLAHDTLLDRTVAVKFLPAQSAEALSRFLVEARAMARLQHPNVVTLYRVGQLEDRAYLVSEYVHGMSLDREKKPLASERLLEVAIDLARGLNAAHARGVLHRDVKPGNAVITDTGEVKLVDFGLAKLATQTDESLALSTDLTLDPGTDASAPLTFAGSDGALVGTPYFMAPEAWRGEELTARSDLFSLGAMLYELGAGKGPFRDVPLPELPNVLSTKDAVPLSEAAPEVDKRLAAIVDRCLKREPSDRYGSAAELLDALEALATSEDASQIPEGNPYRGLRAFEAEHRALFFGRRRELKQVVERLRADAFVLVTGDSGVGKSSLCRAGVLPSIIDGALEDGRQWRSVKLVPGRSPAVALAGALNEALGLSAPELELLIARDAAELGRTVRRKLEQREGLVLFVDQLEELVTLAAPDEAARVSEALAQLCMGFGGLRVLGSARSDFLTRLAGLPGLGPDVPRALHLLRPMQPEEIREAIVGPARVKGVRYESDAMVEGLVAATVSAQGGLPLLQFALAELWESREQGSQVITQSALDRVGGVSGALARHADGVLAQLLPEQRVAARSLLLRLVSDEGTRSRRTDQELVGNDPRFRAALDALVRSRLLVASDAPDGAAAYEIAHEALLHGWGTLSKWLAEEAERREIQERLEASAGQWEKSGRPRDALWSQRQLSEAARLEPEALTTRAHAFIVSSKANVRRSRFLLRGGAVLFVLSLIAVWNVVRLRNEAQRNHEIDTLLASATSAFSDAQARSQEVEALRRQAFTLFDGGNKKEGEPVWTRVQAREREVERAYTEASDRFEKALLLGEERRDVREAFADFLFERAMRADRIHQPLLRDLLLQRMRVYDEGGVRAAQWSKKAEVSVSTTPAGARVTVARYERVDDKLVLQPGRELGASPSKLELEPGSYLLTFNLEGHEAVRYPLRVERGEKLPLQLALPRDEQVPEQLVYVPPGRFVFGSSQDESIREFFNTVPLHEVATDGFLIGRTEVTFADWIRYLEALPEPEREQRTPRVASVGLHGHLQLALKKNKWTLSMQPQSKPYVATESDRIEYQGRGANASQDWLKFPVSGISSEDARAYAAWLSSTGQLPGARLCTEQEWERAARGADDREYPHGYRLDPADANFDVTYGKTPEAFGPDEVGRHPASQSPFGLQDMSGNVWEWATSSLTRGEIVARGGSFYFASNSARVSNRELPEPTLRDANVGLRLCASAPAL